MRGSRGGVEGRAKHALDALKGGDVEGAIEIARGNDRRDPL